MDRNEFDEFEIDFKPINKGLGFHQHKEQVKPNINKTTPRVRAGNLTGDLITKAPVALQPRPALLARKNKRVVAAGLDRFVSWLIDSICITSLFLTIVFIFVYYTEVGIQSLKEFSMVFGGAYCVLYLLYFTILDFGVTPGKHICGLRLHSIAGERLRVSQTFMRAFVTLTAGLLLFVPILLKSADKVSQTIVYRR